MSGFYNKSSMETLIKAVKEYRGELETNYKVLQNAANVCDLAMGNDALSARHIKELQEALTYLDKVAKIAEEVEKALVKDKAEADDI